MYFNSKELKMLKENNLGQIKDTIPPEFAYQNKVVPLEINKNILKVGIHQGNQKVIEDLEFITGMQINYVELSEDEIIKLLKSQYGDLKFCVPTTHELGEFVQVEKDKESESNGILRREIDELSVVSLVNKIITGAIETKASDIHIEAYEDQFRVRYRRDGILQEVLNPPVEKKRAIISRLKIMADLDIAEKRRPQDGRIRVRRGDRIIDIRVSTLPTDFGEKMVLRILDKSQLNLDLSKLGFEENMITLYKKAIESPYGMILVTGPTGSGKTTTLYATLNNLNSPEVNILTIEDPIEYNLNGINQSQVRSDIGFTFANALRSFLRQDPDIIMVGEIRDQETAEIAIRSALTGHLVLSTLHTNNAPDTLTRLLDMDQEPFLISSSVRMVIAQRLLRTICEHCKTEDPEPDKLNHLIESFVDDLKDITFYKGKGCHQCNQTGYLGRTAVFEVMPITQVIAEAINRRATAQELKTIAITEGMCTLQKSAILKLQMGITTIAEIVRETEI